MPKSVTVVLNDEMDASVEQYLDTQRQVAAHPVTGAAVSKRVHADTAAFIRAQIGSLLESIAKQYPPASVAEKQAQIEVLQKQVREASMPDVFLDRAGEEPVNDSGQV